MAVWVVCELFPRILASTRCWLWRLGLSKSLLHLLLVPQIDLAFLPRARTVLASVVSEELASALPTRAALRIGLSQPLMAAWLVGVVTMDVVYVAMAGARARSIASRCTPIRCPEIDVAAASLCRHMGLRQMPEIVCSLSVPVPMTLKFASRYVVVVPADLLDPERQNDLMLAMAHELAHIRRKDLTWNWLPSVVRMLFYFNPMAWVASGELAIAQEMACDEMAIGTTGAGAAEYGRLLLAMVTPGSMVGSSCTVAAASAGAPVNAMHRRLVELKRLTEAPAARLSSAALALVIVCTLVMPFRIVETARERAPGLSTYRVEHSDTATRVRYTVLPVE